MKLRSPAYQMDFFNVIPKSLYLEGINQMKLILAVYIIASSIGGIGIAWYVSKRNYQPVKELLELTGKSMQESEDGNEMGFEKEEAGLFCDPHGIPKAAVCLSG